MALIQNIISYLSPFNQLLLLQKFFTNGIIYGIKTIIPDYTNDDSGMYKIINYYGKNKDNLSKIYFFLSLFAKQLNYGEYDEKTQKIKTGTFCYEIDGQSLHDEFVRRNLFEEEELVEDRREKSQEPEDRFMFSKDEKDYVDKILDENERLKLELKHLKEKYESK